MNEREALAKQLFLHKLTQDMADADMRFLNSGGIFRGDDNREVGEVLEFSSVSA